MDSKIFCWIIMYHLVASRRNKTVEREWNQVEAFEKNESESVLTYFFATLIRILGLADSPHFFQYNRIRSVCCFKTFNFLLREYRRRFLTTQVVLCIDLYRLCICILSALQKPLNLDRQQGFDGFSTWLQHFSPSLALDFLSPIEGRIPSAVAKDVTGVRLERGQQRYSANQKFVSMATHASIEQKVRIRHRQRKLSLSRSFDLLYRKSSAIEIPKEILRRRHPHHPTKQWRYQHQPPFDCLWMNEAKEWIAGRSFYHRRMPVPKERNRIPTNLKIATQ
mmetsp:Transcript_998/g.2318  ORF Transcript_998/g.2318 Transcript_998/m.2318 type:complete len:279 (-) Transcript_998:185-1021(-)